MLGSVADDTSNNTREQYIPCSAIQTDCILVLVHISERRKSCFENRQQFNVFSTFLQTLHNEFRYLIISINIVGTRMGRWCH